MEMRMTMSDASLVAFMAFSGVRLIAYFPQIYRITRDRNGASVISYTTWALWTGCHVSTGLYAAMNLGDALLAAASALYALCCLAVIVITAKKRHRFHLRYSLEESRPLIASVADSGADGGAPTPVYASRTTA
jgi:hypothetical protein